MPLRRLLFWFLAGMALAVPMRAAVAYACDMSVAPPSFVELELVEVRRGFLNGASDAELRAEAGRWAETGEYDPVARRIDLDDGHFLKLQ